MGNVNTYSPAFKQVFNGKGILTTYSTSTQLAHRHEQPSHQGKTFHIVFNMFFQFSYRMLDTVGVGVRIEHIVGFVFLTT